VLYLRSNSSFKSTGVDDNWTLRFRKDRLGLGFFVLLPTQKLKQHKRLLALFSSFGFLYSRVSTDFLGSFAALNPNSLFVYSPSWRNVSHFFSNFSISQNNGFVFLAFFISQNLCPPSFSFSLLAYSSGVLPLLSLLTSLTYPFFSYNAHLPSAAKLLPYAKIKN
jgi:hypothetical protein